MTKIIKLALEWISSSSPAFDKHENGKGTHENGKSSHENGHLNANVVVGH
jgi:hypothetical protein